MSYSAANFTNDAKNIVATFTQAGTYTFVATISDGTSSTTSSVSVTVASTLTSIGINSPDSSVDAGSSEQFSAAGFDQFGNQLATQPAFTWSLGSGSSGAIDANGFYTAGSAADTIIAIASVGNVTGSASLTVNTPTGTGGGGGGGTDPGDPGDPGDGNGDKLDHYRKRHSGERIRSEYHLE